MICAPPGVVGVFTHSIIAAKTLGFVAKPGESFLDEVWELGIF